MLTQSHTHVSHHHAKRDRPGFLKSKRLSRDSGDRSKQATVTTYNTWLRLRRLHMTYRVHIITLIGGASIEACTPHCEVDVVYVFTRRNGSNE